MTDRYRVYTKVLQTLKRQLKMYRQGHVVTLAMMITGIVMSHKAQLAVMSGEVPTDAKEKSTEMRMRRWVKHEMVEWVQTQTDWYFVLRTSPNIKVRQGQVWRRVDTYSKQKGSLVTAYQVAFTKTAALSLNLVAWWGATYEEPIYLITNLPNGSRACWFYKRRFRIETFFSDQKSRGFHIHKSHLSDPIRISRLLIAACLAYIWMICFFFQPAQLGGNVR